MANKTLAAIETLRQAEQGGRLGNLIKALATDNEDHVVVQFVGFIEQAHEDGDHEAAALAVSTARSVFQKLYPPKKRGPRKSTVQGTVPVERPTQHNSGE